MILIDQLSGNVIIEQALKLTGEVINGNLTKIPNYEGSYIVTPSTSVQTLQTNGKKMTDDVTIEAVPEYSGVYTVNPSVNPQTLDTDGKLLTQDITVNAMPVYSGSYNVIPSTSQQTLLTDEKYLTENVVINGVPEYQGSYVIMPSSSQQTLQTNGKLMNDDLTVTAVPSYAGSYSVTPSNAVQMLATNGYMMEDDVIVTKIPEPYDYNMMHYEGNKGFRQLNGSISGNGTDPNWMWWDLVPTSGFTKLKHYLNGYSTVASIMFFNANRQKLSEIHTNSTLSGTTDIPEGAYFVAISGRSTVNYPAQYCYLL